MSLVTIRLLIRFGGQYEVSHYMDCELEKLECLAW